MGCIYFETPCMMNKITDLIRLVKKEKKHFVEI